MNKIINTHTPAEWQIGAGPHTRDREVFDNDGWLIADCRTSTRGAAEERANARLIAAAPELLEALKLLHGYTRESDAAYRNGFGDTDPLYSAVAAAIAKAEGRAE